MNILAMETSTLLGGVAVIIDGKVVAEESSMRDRSHSEIINTYVERCLLQAGLRLSDIDIFATGHGPGSFTGIRVAANAAKSYAYAFGKPLVTLDTLYLMAVQIKKSSYPVLSIVNAYKNMVYLGLFEMTGEHPKYVTGPLAVPVRDLSDFITSDVTVVGDGYIDYHEYFPPELASKMHRPLQVQDFPLASTLGLCAEQAAKDGHTLDWNSFRPLYIRASEAEEKKQGIVIKPLN